MASQVLSGTGNVSYTNNTGQNVRIVINFMSSDIVFNSTVGGNGTTLTIGWGSASTSIPFFLTDKSIYIGRNIAAVNGQNATSTTSFQNMSLSQGDYAGFNNTDIAFAFPTELMLATGQSFSASGVGSYNIVVIPEAG